MNYPGASNEDCKSVKDYIKLFLHSTRAQVHSTVLLLSTGDKVLLLQLWNYCTGINLYFNNCIVAIEVKTFDLKKTMTHFSK